MIKKLEISGQHVTVTPELQRYVHRKIGRLDRYIARAARQSVHAEVKLKEIKRKDKKDCTCTVVMYLPHGEIDAHETTINMFAAIDIAENKLKTQLKKYKDTHTDGKLHRWLYARLTLR